MFNFFDKSDSKIREDVISEMAWDPSFSATAIQVTAKEGVVTLTGSVPHYIEKMAAEHAAQRVGGVKAVAIGIRLAPRADATEVKSTIEAALKRSAANEGRQISVTASGNTVTLSGIIQSHSESEVACQAAWMAPGVTQVINNLKISQ